MTTFVIRPNDINREQIIANAVQLIGKLSALKPWQVVVEPYVKKRTDVQNHALFGVAYPAIEAETGHTKDELHEAFCKRFFGTVQREVFGALISKAYRTTTTDENGRRDVIGTEAFARFYTMVQQVGAEAGVHVPDPIPQRDTEKHMNHSTGRATKSQQARFVKIKEDGCLCCRIESNCYVAPDIHHLKAGNRRIGHDASIGLCLWHHRGNRDTKLEIYWATNIIPGPSLANGSRTFHEHYGSDDHLLELQNARIA